MATESSLETGIWVTGVENIWQVEIMLEFFNTLEKTKQVWKFEIVFQLNLANISRTSVSVSMIFSCRG